MVGTSLLSFAHPTSCQNWIYNKVLAQLLVNKMMNKNARCYYESAIKLFLPLEELPQVEGFRLILGRKNYYFCGSGTPLNNSGSITLTRNKYSMNKTLAENGFPVPKATFVHYSEFTDGLLAEKIAELSFPLVAKPQIGKLGNGVLCNIQTFAQLQNYMEINSEAYEYVTIEEFHSNLNSYRVLIFNNKVLGVIQRYPAHVVGDGQHNLQELIDITNKRRLEISDTLAPIVVDEECQIRLAELGLDLSHIPKADEELSLAYTCNASRGGTYRSLGKSICKENKRLLIHAAKQLNLSLVGFDIQCADINQPFVPSRDVIIESNDGPSVRIHEYPIEGQAVSISNKIIRSLIYRHPFSYLHALYKNQRSGVYVRALILAAFLAVTYFSLMKQCDRLGQGLASILCKKRVALMQR